MRARLVHVTGAAASAAGAFSWALAAGSTEAARRGEVAAQADATAGTLPAGVNDPAALPTPDELVLLVHDVRLGGLVTVLCGVALLVGPSLRRVRWPLPALLGVAATLVVANATLGRVVGEGVAAAVVGASALLTVTALAAGTSRLADGLARPAPLRDDVSRRGWWCATVAAVAAATAPAIGLVGVDSPARSPYVPDAVAVAEATCAVSLVVIAGVGALAALTSARAGVVTRALVLAACVVPGALAAVTLLAAEGWAGPVTLYGILLLPGGLLSMAAIGPAGAVIGVDGLPMVGGGVGVGLAVVGVIALTQACRAGADAPVERSPGPGPEGARTA